MMEDTQQILNSASVNQHPVEEVMSSSAPIGSMSPNEPTSSYLTGNTDDVEGITNVRHKVLITPEVPMMSKDQVEISVSTVFTLPPPSLPVRVSRAGHTRTSGIIDDESDESDGKLGYEESAFRFDTEEDPFSDMDTPLDRPASKIKRVRKYINSKFDDSGIPFARRTGASEFVGFVALTLLGCCFIPVSPVIGGISASVCGIGSFVAFTSSSNSNWASKLRKMKWSAKALDSWYWFISLPLTIPIGLLAFVLMIAFSTMRRYSRNHAEGYVAKKTKNWNKNESQSSQLVTALLIALSGFFFLGDLSANISKIVATAKLFGSLKLPKVRVSKDAWRHLCEEFEYTEHQMDDLFELCRGDKSDLLKSRLEKSKFEFTTANAPDTKDRLSREIALIEHVLAGNFDVSPLDYINEYSEYIKSYTERNKMQIIYVIIGLICCCIVPFLVELVCTNLDLRYTVKEKIRLAFDEFKKLKRSERLGFVRAKFGKFDYGKHFRLKSKAEAKRSNKKAKALVSKKAFSVSTPRKTIWLYDAQEGRWFEAYASDVEEHFSDKSRFVTAAGYRNYLLSHADEFDLTQGQYDQLNDDDFTIQGWFGEDWEVEQIDDDEYEEFRDTYDDEEIEYDEWNPDYGESKPEPLTSESTPTQIEKRLKRKLAKKAKKEARKATIEPSDVSEEAKMLAKAIKASIQSDKNEGKRVIATVPIPKIESAPVAPVAPLTPAGKLRANTSEIKYHVDHEAYEKARLANYRWRKNTLRHLPEDVHSRSFAARNRVGVPASEMAGAYQPIKATWDKNQVHFKDNAGVHIGTAVAIGQHLVATTHLKEAIVGLKIAGFTDWYLIDDKTTAETDRAKEFFWGCAKPAGLSSISVKSCEGIAKGTEVGIFTSEGNLCRGKILDYGLANYTSKAGDCNAIVVDFASNQGIGMHIAGRKVGENVFLPFSNYTIECFKRSQNTGKPKNSQRGDSQSTSPSQVKMDESSSAQ